MFEMFEFFDTEFLRNDEIYLNLTGTIDEDLERELVPSYYFDICSLENETVMGHCDLRIGHNQKLYYGGNIGYNVKPEFRGHHYAGKACRLLFELAKKHELGYVIITCNPENIASRKTCEYAGGKLTGIVPLPPDNDMYLEGEREKCIYKFCL